jgi:D-inositol-3-phosphate glycosyltransferase
MKRRIALITEYAPLLTDGGNLKIGDVISDVSELIRQLSANRWKVDVFTTKGNSGNIKVSNFGPDIRLIEVNGSSSNQFRQFTSASKKSFCLRLLNFIADQNLTYQLIHSNLFESAGIAVELKKRLKVPVVVSLTHFPYLSGAGDGTSRLQGSKLKTEVDILRKVDALFVDCPNLTAKLIERYKENLQKTFFVSKGFNPQELLPISKTMARLHLNLGVDEKILLYIGDLNLEEGSTSIIKSMILLEPSNQPVRLILLHESRTATNFNKDKLLYVAESLGLKKQVVIIDEPGNTSFKYYYAASDLFLATSFSAISGDFVLKSMAFGTPVLTIRANQTLVVDGRTGFLISAVVAQVLADRINLLINNDLLLKQMSREALGHVYTNFTWEKIAKRVLVLYEHVLSVPRRKQKVVPVYSTKSTNKRNPGLNVFAESNVQPNSNI